MGKHQDPIKQTWMLKFDGKQWALFGEFIEPQLYSEPKEGFVMLSHADDELLTRTG